MKYKVKVCETVYRTAEVEIEADDENQAKESIQSMREENARSNGEELDLGSLDLEIEGE